MAEIERNSTFQKLWNDNFQALINNDAQRFGNKWLLEGLYPSLPVKIARLAETYLTLVVAAANKNLTSPNINLQFTRSGLLRSIRPNDRLDYVRKQFSGWSEIEGLKRFPKAHKLLKRLGIGSNDLDIKWGRKRDFSTVDEELFSEILFRTGLSFFGGLAVMPADDRELEKFKELEKENRTGALKDRTNLIDETSKQDGWRHAFFILPNGISVDVGFGKRKENYVGEIVFNQGGKDIFMIHTGSHVYNAQKMSTDTRSGDDVSNKSQLAITLKVKNAPPLSLSQKELFEAKYIVDSPAHIKQSSIPPEFSIMNSVHEALRDCRTCGIFFPGVSTDNGQLIERIFDRPSWQYLRRVFVKARELFGRYGHQKFISESMQEEYIKDQAVMLNANPYDALMMAIMTDNLRIFPFFADVPVYYFYSLLASDAFTHQLVRDEVNVNTRIRLPKYKRNWAAISKQRALWLKTEYPGLKLMLNSVVGETRNVDRGGERMTVDDLGKILETDPGILTFNPTRNHGEFFLPEKDYINLFQEKVKMMNDLVEMTYRDIPIYLMQRVSRRLSEFIEKKERSFVYWDSLLSELGVNQTQTESIKKFFYNSGLMTAIGEPDSNIATFTPPEIIDEIWDEQILIRPSLVEKLIEDIIEKDHQLVKLLHPMQPSTAAHLFTKFYLPEVYPSAAAIFYHPPGSYDLILQAPNLLAWASNEQTSQSNGKNNGNSS